MLKFYCKLILLYKTLYVCVFCFPLQNNTQFMYDQRQTGKYNVHISIKDVAIIEVNKNDFFDDTGNDADDYYYDDDVLTIKPTATLISLTNSTMKIPSSNSAPTKIPLSQFSINESETNTGNMSTMHTEIPESVVTKPVLSTQEQAGAKIASHIRQKSGAVKKEETRNNNSVIRRLLTPQAMLQKKYACNANNQNCVKRRRLSLLNNLLAVLQLIRK